MAVAVPRLWLFRGALQLQYSTSDLSLLLPLYLVFTVKSDPKTPCCLYNTLSTPVLLFLVHPYRLLARAAHLLGQCGYFSPASFSRRTASPKSEKIVYPGKTPVFLW
jgi:hypothetical protein